jgi:hypothetical protein
MRISSVIFAVVVVGCISQQAHAQEESCAVYKSSGYTPTVQVTSYHEYAVVDIIGNGVPPLFSGHLKDDPDHCAMLSLLAREGYPYPTAVTTSPDGFPRLIFKTYLGGNTCNGYVQVYRTRSDSVLEETSTGEFRIVDVGQQEPSTALALTFRKQENWEHCAILVVVITTPNNLWSVRTAEDGITTLLFIR